MHQHRAPLAWLQELEKSRILLVIALVTWANVTRLLVSELGVEMPAHRVDVHPGGRGRGGDAAAAPEAGGHGPGAGRVRAAAPLHQPGGRAETDPERFCGPFPRRVHFVHGLWEDVPLSRKHLEALETWRTHNPGYTREIWNMSALESVLPAAEFRQLSAIKVNGNKVDMARYLLLQRVGGVYADLDVYCFGPMDELLGCRSSSAGPAAGGGAGSPAAPPAPAQRPGTQFVAVVESEQPAFPGMVERPTRVANYFFASAAAAAGPMRAIIATVAKRMKERPNVATAADVLYTTGPDAVTETVFPGSMGDARLLPGVRLAGKAEADKYINHHARGGWRRQVNPARV